MNLTGNTSQCWLLTGGAGYIGAHVAHALLRIGLQIVVVDDLSTGDRRNVPAEAPLYKVDVCDEDAVFRILERHDIDGVIHLAALKSVEESVSDPLLYWRVNAGGTAALLRAACKAGIGSFVLSSSSSVYGDVRTANVTEAAATVPINPYGRTKLVGEQILADAARAHGLRWVALRYFNVAGAGHPSLMDKSHTTLFPTMLRSLSIGQPPVIFGEDYPTADGSCVRDFIHVVDLAEAHVAAALSISRSPLNCAINVGTGTGASVREVIDAARSVTGIELPARVAPRRPGDAPQVVGDVSLAEELLGWTAQYSLLQMVESAWAGQRDLEERVEN